MFDHHQRAAAGLTVASVGLLLTIAFHLGARGILNRGFQASLESVALLGLLAAAAGLWTLRPGGARRVAMALALPAAAGTAFVAYVFASFPLALLLEEPLAVASGLLGVGAWWITALAAWRWAGSERDAGAVAGVRIGLGLVALGAIISMGNDVAIGLTSMLHASLLGIAGFGLAAASLEPVAAGAGQPAPARAGAAALRR